MTNIDIYSTQTCPYCTRAKSLLDKKNAKYNEIDIRKNPDKRDEMLERSGGKQTVPQIFIGDKHVGGYDDLHELDKKGKLDDLLEN